MIRYMRLFISALGIMFIIFLSCKSRQPLSSDTSEEVPAGEVCPLVPNSVPTSESAPVAVPADPTLSPSMVLKPNYNDSDDYNDSDNDSDDDYDSKYSRSRMSRSDNKLRCSFSQELMLFSNFVQIAQRSASCTIEDKKRLNDQLIKLMFRYGEVLDSQADNEIQQNKAQALENQLAIKQMEMRLADLEKMCGASKDAQAMLQNLKAKNAHIHKTGHSPVAPDSKPTPTPMPKPMP